MSKLETYTHVSLIAVSLVSIFVLLERRFAPTLGRPDSAAALVGKAAPVTGRTLCANMTETPS